MLNNKKKKQKTFIVISGDGGGMKGISPLTILSEISRKTGLHTSDYAFLCVGCSTSTIGQGGLMVPDENNKDRPAFSEDEIRHSYFQDGPVIFPDSRFNFTAKQKDFIKKRKLKFSKNSLLGFLFNGSIYSDKNLKAVLKKKFGDMEAKDCLNYFCYPTTDFKNGKTVWFTNHPELAKKHEDTYYTPNMKMRDIVEACVRPNVYFKYADMEIEFEEENPKTKEITPTDGTYFAGCPEAYAYHFAETMLKNQGYERDEYRIVVLSLGTGENLINHTTEELNGGKGILSRIFKGSAQIKGLMTSVSLAFTLQFRARAAELRRRMWDNGDLLFRFEAPIDPANPNHPDSTLTNASRDNLNKIVDFTLREMIEKNQEEFDTFVDVVKRTQNYEDIEDIARKCLKENYKPLKQENFLRATFNRLFSKEPANDNQAPKPALFKKKSKNTPK